MKEKYFETVEGLRPIITRNLYEELKSDFVRKRVFYSALLIVYISMLVTFSYEIILGFEVGFWTENMPAWSGFRFGLVSQIFGGLGAIIIYAFGADIFNASVSWLVLPFFLDKDITKKAYLDPDILRKVKSFEKFTKNLLNMTLIIVLMICLALLWVILQPVPVPPTGYIWGTIIMFLAVPIIYTSQLRGRAIRKTIKILEQQYTESKEAGLECEAGKNADGLFDSHRAENDHIESQKWLKIAAESYEECGAYFEAAQRHSKLGNYKRAAVCYKKASDKEEDVEKKKYYKACAYTESTEEFIEAYNRAKASECLSLAATYFNDIAKITSNLHLKYSAIYRSREARGRLIVFDAFKIYEEEIDKKKILNNVSRKLTDARSIFEETSEVCPGIGEDAETQLKVHALMCKFYKQYISFKHDISEYEIDATTEVRAGPKFWGLKRGVTKRYRPGEFSKLDECILIIQEISKKLLDIYKFKAAKKAEMIEYALSGYKFYKQGKNEEALENIEIAENISKNEFGKPVEATLLRKKITELTNSIFYTDFPFSAPMCVAVDPDAYKNCIEFENETEVPKEVSRNEDVHFTFKLNYKPCTPYLENLIKLKLKLTHLGREVTRELDLAVEEAAIHEQFLVTGNNLTEGENYIRAELFHFQKDCERKIATKEFMVQRT